MRQIVEALETIVRDGAALAAYAEADAPRLQDWLDEREAVFRRLPHAFPELDEVDRQTLGCLFQEMLRLDGVILPQLEARLSQLGKEIGGARKIQRWLGSSGRSHQAAFLHRTL